MSSPVLAYLIPSEAIATAFGVVVAAAVHNFLWVVRLRERVARLEEWIRVYEIGPLHEHEPEREEPE